MSEGKKYKIWAREYMLSCHNLSCKRNGELLHLIEHEHLYIFQCEGCGNEVQLTENSLMFRI